MRETELSAQEKASAIIAGCHKDQEMEIHGRKYKFLKTNHKTRRAIYAYFTSIVPLLAVQNMSFLDDPKWEKIESMIHNIITFEDMQLSKVESHFDKFPQDYILFSTTAIQVISHPFLAGNPTA